MNLSDHFEQDEFELDAPLPPECVVPYTNLCKLILEPVRARVAEPMRVTSGYRPPDANTAAGGVAHSEHMADATKCAADWNIWSARFNMRTVFDWIRLHPSLPFHQVILEHDPRTGTDVIHTSWNSTINLFTDRVALEGETNGQAPYKHWPTAPFVEASQ